MSDGVSQIYSDSADLGIFLVSVTVLVALVVSVIMFLYSILLFLQHDPHTMTTTGVATVIDCTKLLMGNYRCRFDVTYRDIEGNGHVLPVELDRMEEMKEGESVSVHYDPDRPEDAIAGKTPKQQASMMLGFAVTAFIISVISLWLVRRFKILAAAQGAVAVFGLF